DQLPACPVPPELPARLQLLEATRAWGALLLPPGNGLAQRTDPGGKACGEMLPDVPQGRSLQRRGLVAHPSERVDLDVEVANVAEGVLEVLDDPVHPPHPLAVLEEPERGTQTAGGHPGVVHLVRAEAWPQLAEVPLDVRQAPHQQRARRHRHGRGGLETGNGGRLGHRRGAPYRGSRMDGVGERRLRGDRDERGAEWTRPGDPGPDRHGGSNFAAGGCRQRPRSSESISPSSSVSAAAATFSSRCCTEEVPGMGSITGEWSSSQASATWAGVTSCAFAARSRDPPGRVRSPAPTGYQGRNPRPSRSHTWRTSSDARSPRL